MKQASAQEGARTTEQLPCWCPQSCPDLFALPPWQCLSPQPSKGHQPRKLARPRRSHPPHFELAPLKFTADQYAEFFRLLPLPDLTDLLGFQSGLYYFARQYRDWIVQETLDVSRANERAAVRKIRSATVKLESTLGALSAEQYEIFAKSLSHVDCGPDLNRNRFEWLRTLPGAARELVEIVAAQTHPTAKALKVSKSAEAFADKLARADDRCQRGLLVHLESASKNLPPDDDPIAALRKALKCIIDAADKSEAWLLTKHGQDTNGNLHQMVAWLDELATKHTGQPMRHRGGPDGHYSGQPEAASDRFLVAFFGHIYATLPPCLKQLKPTLYKPNASLDAFKEHITKRNKSAREAQLA